MQSYILITGATSGIGYEMAQNLAEKKFNLILVSRNVDKMIIMKKQLQSSYGIIVDYFEKDLSLPNEAKELLDDILLKEYRVSHLINNAGFGEYGHFLNTSLEVELKMINLNITGLVILTKLFAKDMAARGGGKILNVASLLSFIPFPYYSVYSATKSFVLAFSETIAAEVEEFGVVLTTLCPGPVETPFQTDEMRHTNAMKVNKPMSAKLVAAKGIDLLLYGKGKKIVGLNNWFISNLPRITPDYLMMKIKKYLASKRN
jgi:short-subunit dehydrogenase